MGKSSFPGFKKLHMLSDPVSNAFRGRFESSLDPLDVKRGETDVNGAITVAWEMGMKTPADFVWTTDAFPIIVNRRVIELLIKVSSTGWKTYPIKLEDHLGHTIAEEYFGLQILGRCGPMHLHGSEIILNQMPGGWFPYIRGHYFVENSWDSSDMFMHERDENDRVTAHVLITEKVVEAFQKEKIKNVSLERLTEVTVSSSVYEIGSPNLLPADYEAKVTRAYASQGVPRPLSVTVFR